MTIERPKVPSKHQSPEAEDSSRDVPRRERYERVAAPHESGQRLSLLFLEASVTQLAKRVFSCVIDLF